MLEIKSKSDFKREIIDAKMPVIVDFYRTYCGQCKMVERLYGSLENQFKDKVAFTKVNIDDGDCLEVAKEWNVNHLPTFALFSNGTLVGSLSGACTKSKLEELLNSI